MSEAIWRPMSAHAQEKLYRKRRREILLIQAEIKTGANVTIEHLCEKFDWCRTKAHSALQDMWLLGVLKTKKDESSEDTSGSGSRG